MAQARRIAARFDAAARFAGAKVTTAEGVSLYLPAPLRPSDIWLVRPHDPEDEGRLGAGLVVAVSKQTGQVLYRGMVGE
jgi:hypothetical protein